MLELVGTVIERLVELILERKLDKKKHGGCARLFQLHWALRDIIAESKKLCSLLEQHARKPSESYISEIFLTTKILTMDSANFMGMVWQNNRSILIYDKKLCSELAKIVDIKTNFLSALCQKMPSTYDEAYQEMKKGMMDFEVDFSKFKVPKYYGSPLHIWDEPFETMRKIKGVKVRIIDLNKQEDVLRFVEQARQNVEVFEKTMEKLRLFIQRNCKYDDLFQ